MLGILPKNGSKALEERLRAPPRHFLVATRQGLPGAFDHPSSLVAPRLCVLDGVSGAQLYVCQAEQPITSITLTSECLVTAHIGNCVQFWELKTQVRSRDGA